MLNRRRLLTIGGSAVAGGILGGALLAPRGAKPPVVTAAVRPAGHAVQSDLLLGHEHHAAGGYSGAGAATGAPFSVPMPVPRVLSPVTRRDDADEYRVAITQANVEILPGLTTPVLSYGGDFGGPTIRARTGRRALVTYTNKLTEPVTVHLHGGNVPAASDGYPTDLIAPGASRTYEYPNKQQGATLWYHDHTHMMEAEHVYRGLHGMYVIEDPAEAYLGLPSREFDVPIILRDAQFDDKGNFVYGNPALRNVILTNGKPQPYFAVAARKYRFRVLNCATERTFRLRLAGADMVQIASDGGLLPAPVTRTDVAIGPGERSEIVVDFSRHRVGDQLVLTDDTGAVLRFDVTRQAADFSRVPSVLRPLAAFAPATVTRDVRLSFDLTGDPVGNVNGRPYDPNRDDFVVKRGTTEIWNITNDIYEHNFHLHLVQFRVLDRGGNPPTLDDAGRKDTVPVPPSSSVRVQVTFDSDYVGRYVFHCHFLEHSSIGMMAQMNIVP
jgi:FtsP/CotA-like multicopper oxidase with cupredoxin domain